MKLGVAVIAGIQVLLACLFAWATPVGGAPDEHAHVEYVRILAEEGRLPALDLSQPRNRNTDKNYEAHQPPLYYLAAVPAWHAAKLVAGPDAGAWGARGLSILLGAAGVVLIWLLIREVSPGRPVLATLGATLAALLPMRLHVVASVSNDALTEATCTLALLLMARSCRGAWDTRQALRLGAALGLAVLTKLSAVMLLPAALAAVYGASCRPAAPPPPSPPSRPPAGGKGRKRRPPPEEAPPLPPPPGFEFDGRRFLRTGLVVLGVLVLLTGWLFARNQWLYGDPLGKKAFDWYFLDTTRFEDWRRGGYTFQDYLGRKVFPTTFATFWGAFGHLDPTRPDLFMGAYGPGGPSAAWGYPPRSWIYPWLAAATLLSLVGNVVSWAVAVVSRRLRPAPAAREVGIFAGEHAPAQILTVHAVFVCASFLNFNATYFQAQGRYLFPALGALSLLLTRGWLAPAGLFRGHIRCRAEWAITALAGSALLVLALYAALGVIRPGFGWR